jgi:acetyltransferase-like isoleucine patch superfamily enzyme
VESEHGASASGASKDVVAAGGSPLAARWRLSARLGRAASSLLNPLVYAHAFRLLHFYGYSHVGPRRRLTTGRGTRLAPNVSLRNGERITIGPWTRVGERASLWAGDQTGTITIGAHTVIGPEVFITASDYGTLPGEYIAYQERSERDIVIGDNVWLGARVFIGAGVMIGNGCVVGAGSVVTRSLPPNSVAVGFPARIVRRREEPPPVSDDVDRRDAEAAS